MSTDNSIDLTPAELLYQYLGARISKDGRESPLAELLADFDLYCQELDRMRSMLREAQDSSARGESALLDMDDVIRRGRERFAREGSAD